MNKRRSKLRRKQSKHVDMRADLIWGKMSAELAGGDLIGVIVLTKFGNAKLTYHIITVTKQTNEQAKSQQASQDANKQASQQARMKTNKQARQQTR